MLEIWNNRYGQAEYAYGKAPNNFFRDQLEKLEMPAGKMLLPAEGEGRNAVYAAKMGWKVDAFDISEEGKKKAMKLAAENGVDLNYHVGEFQQMDFELESFDVVGLIYAHFPPPVRAFYHNRIMQLLKPGGIIIFEAFSKKQLIYNEKQPSAGGPKKAEMLYSTDEIRGELTFSKFLTLQEVEIELYEGKYHQGTSSVIRCLAMKQ